MTSPHLSDTELEALLRDLESDRVERKESFKGDTPTKAREAVCAFANDLPDHRLPGVIFVGVSDDGSPVGLEVSDDLLLRLSAMKSDGNIVPPPTLVVQKRTIGGSDLAVVIVAPADSPPVRYRGRTWVRVGPQRSIATRQEERILSEKRRSRDRPHDVQPVRSAVIDDLDVARFQSEYLPAAVAREVLAANDRSVEERLAATKMIASIDDTTPTVMGLLVLGRRTRDFLPGAYVQFLRVEGTELGGPVIDDSLIDGTVTDVVLRLDEKFRSHNRTRVDFTSESVERRVPTYPPAALQQIARNAVLHRTYEGTSAPVRVTWYDDRIEISSPGGPYGEVTVNNFGHPGITDYRNPNLAEALRVLGFVQKFGGGIATARRALAENGNPELEFDLKSGFVLATLRSRP